MATCVGVSLLGPGSAHANLSYVGKFAYQLAPHVFSIEAFDQGGSLEADNVQFGATAVAGVYRLQTGTSAGASRIIGPHFSRTDAVQCVAEPPIITATSKTSSGQLVLRRRTVGLGDLQAWEYHWKVSFSPVAVPVPWTSSCDILNPDGSMGHADFPQMSDVIFLAAKSLRPPKSDPKTSRGCLPPMNLSGKDTRGDHKVTIEWDFTRIGTPSRSDKWCFQRTGRDYYKLTPVTRRHVQKLYQQLDKFGALYQFKRGYRTAADIAVQFPPGYVPNLGNYRVAAKRAGLIGPTRAMPDRVKLPPGSER